MNKTQHLKSIYNDAIKNKPFEKIEQFRLFDKISKSHIKKVVEDSYSDEFIDYWNNCAYQRSEFISRMNGLKFETEDDLNDYLAEIEGIESIKSNWLIDYVLIKIPN